MVAEEVVVVLLVVETYFYRIQHDRSVSSPSLSVQHLDKFVLVYGGQLEAEAVVRVVLKVLETLTEVMKEKNEAQRCQQE